MPPATRVGDNSTGHSVGSCYFPPMSATTGSPNVFVNGKPIVREGDFWNTHPGPPCPPHSGNLSSGSSTVFINGNPAGRIGDEISCGDKVAEGSGDVFIGG